mmetsp:Transcript_20992/g.37546  ORF Transcript_20992/g.37546 Transcript_20992/m.37546 type:complete len:378 (+) Transcript_20992:571-1704(+)
MTQVPDQIIFGALHPFGTLGITKIAHVKTLDGEIDDGLVLLLEPVIHLESLVAEDKILWQLCDVVLHSIGHTGESWNRPVRHLLAVILVQEREQWHLGDDVPVTLVLEQRRVRQVELEVQERNLFDLRRPGLGLDFVAVVILRDLHCLRGHPHPPLESAVNDARIVSSLLLLLLLALLCGPLRPLFLVLLLRPLRPTRRLRLLRLFFLNLAHQLVTPHILLMQRVEEQLQKLHWVPLTANLELVLTLERDGLHNLMRGHLTLESSHIPYLAQQLPKSRRQQLHTGVLERRHVIHAELRDTYQELDSGTQVVGHLQVVETHETRPELSPIQPTAALRDRQDFADHLLGVGGVQIVLDVRQRWVMHLVQVRQAVDNGGL